MTVPLEMIFGVLTGLILATCAREQFSIGETPWSRGLAAMVSFGALILLPVSEYYYFVFPDWAWMYLVDPKRLPLGIGLLVVLAFSACMLGGYLSGWALVRAGKPRLLWAALGMVSASLLTFAFFSRGRLLSDGSFASYQAGRALSLGEGKLGYALTITTVGTWLALAWLGQWLVRRGRSVSANADSDLVAEATPGATPARPPRPPGPVPPRGAASGPIVTSATSSSTSGAVEVKPPHPPTRSNG